MNVYLHSNLHTKTYMQDYKATLAALTDAL